MSAVRKKQVLSSPVLAVVVFIFTELMIFSSFISSFVIVKSSFTNWPPMGQPRLPVELTAVNSLFLFASAWTIDRSFKFFAKGSQAKAARYYLATLILGLLFVAIQGFEWAKLIGYGLSITSSVYGGFFYLIIGAHGLHVLAAAAMLLWGYGRFNRLTADVFTAMRLFWFFVVAIWPILYVLVYL